MFGNVMSVFPVAHRIPLVQEHFAVGSEDGPVRSLVAGEVLFRPGDLRTQLYIIESGMIALCCNQPDHPHEVIEFSFTGDVVGLGFLDKHIYAAKTLSKSRLRSLPLSALDDLLQANDRVRHRYDEAVRREFLARRGELIDAFRRKPVSRLASFFLALSQLNTHEGRDTNLIVDSLTCGIVSSCLGLDLDSLGRALVQLERKHLIEATPLGLRLLNLAGLEDLAKEPSDRSAVRSSCERNKNHVARWHPRYHPHHFPARRL